MSSNVLLKTYVELVESGFFGNREPREFIKYALNLIEKGIKERHGILLLAPPGIGKSSIPSIIAFANQEYYRLGILRVLHILPLRSIISDVYRRFGFGLERIGANVINPICRQYSLIHESPFLQSLYTVLTFDMYVYNFFKLPIEELWKIERELSYGHYELPRSGIYSALNFFDESHLMLESLDIGAAALRTILYHLQRTETTYVLSTATLSENIEKSLEKLLGEDKVVTVNYITFIKEKGPDDFYENEMEKKIVPYSKKPVKVENISKLVSLIEEFSSNHSKFLLVVNTVERAVKAYKALISKKPLLLHSRFTLKDRVAKLKLLGESKITVSTQVIEAGVDESFDAVLTELAPISNLIQRFGRLARGDVEYGEWGIFFDNESLQGNGIYDPKLVRRTLNELLNVEKEIHWHLPVIIDGRGKYCGYLKLLDNVWSAAKDLVSIDRSFLSILETFFISSKDVMKYLERLGSFVREDVLCTLYIGEPPEDYWKYVESLDSRAIFMGFSEAISYARKVLEKGFEVRLAKYVKEDRVEVESWNKMPSKELKRKMLRREILAIVIPSELYDGGVYGVGLKR